MTVAKHAGSKRMRVVLLCCFTFLTVHTDKLRGGMSYADRNGREKSPQGELSGGDVRGEYVQGKYPTWVM